MQRRIHGAISKFLVRTLTVSLVGIGLVGIASPASANQIDGTFSTVIGQDGKLYTWGTNLGTSGLLGNYPYNTQPITTPRKIYTGDSTGTFVKVATGIRHSLAIDTSGSAFSWGKNAKGELGFAGNAADQPLMIRVSTIHNSTPTSISGKTIVDISAGNEFSLALDSEGSIHSWGRNDQGQLGNGISQASNFSDTTAGLVTMPAGVTFTSLSAGKDFAVAVASDGDLYTWGAGEKMGVAANTTDYLVPTRLAFFDDKPVKQVASSTDHTVVLTQAGGIYVFGDHTASNVQYQWGSGDTTVASFAPLAISTSIKYINVSSLQRTMSAQPVFTSISAGPKSSAAIDTKGQLYVWGGEKALSPIGIEAMFAYDSSMYDYRPNEYTFSGSSYPTLINTGNVPFDDDYENWTPSPVFETVELGPARVLGVTEAGSLYSWGTPVSSTSGELGIGSTSGTTVPTLVNGGDLGSTAVATAIFSFTEPFALKVETVGSNESVTLGIRKGNWASDYGYSTRIACQAEFQIDWGDGVTETVSLASASTNDVAWKSAFSHTYSTAGFQEIKVTAKDSNTCVSLEGMSNVIGTDRQENEQLIEITSWGFIDNIYAIGSAQSKLLSVPNSLPSQSTNLSSMFNKALVFNGDISQWDTSKVTTLQLMFYRAYDFNQDIGSWDVSSVESMSSTFVDTWEFNQDLSNWVTSAVESFSSTFSGASKFNQPLNNWDVSRATNFSSMFKSAYAFNRDLNSWDVRNATNMSGMFDSAYNFDGNISSWVPSGVENMDFMFSSASSFNQDISAWFTSSLKSMRGMFDTASTFNQNIGGWSTDDVINMSRTFANASVFNRDLNSWNVSKVQNFASMFDGARDFDGDISNWVTGAATDMNLMFQGASSFNQDIGSWNTGNVTDMSEMFDGASSFNRDIGLWNTSKVIDMNQMFKNASIFNQDINYDSTNNSWNVGIVTDMTSMFAGANAFAYCLNWDLTGKTTTSMFNVAYSNASCANLSFDEVLPGSAAVEDLDGYKTGFTLPPLPVTSLVNDTFLGWGTSSAGCVANPPASISGNQTVYAKWTSLCDLVLTVQPTSTNLSPILPIGQAGCYLHVTIDWGDGSAAQTVSASSLSVPGGFPTKTYASAGSYTITVTPLANNTCSSYGSTDAGVRGSNEMITGLGSFPGWISDYSDAFAGAVNLTSVPAALPMTVTDISGMFEGATSFNGDISLWDTSAVTDMSGTFNGATIFNQDISSWDTGSALDMSYMFFGATAFDQDLSGWDTADVTDMSHMFNGATVFNQDISGWDTGSVIDMASMFFDAVAFNQNLSGWDIDDVTDFSSMFDATDDTSRVGYCLGWTLPVGATTTNMYGSTFNPLDCVTIEFEVDGGTAVSNFDYQASGFDLPTPPSTTKAGVTLTGWSLSPNDCQAATFPYSGNLTSPTKFYAVWSDCTPVVAGGGSAPYAGPVVSSIGGKPDRYDTQIGARVRLDLKNAFGLTKVFVGGVEAEIVVNEIGEAIFIVPAGLELGVHDLTIITDSGKLTVQDAIGLLTLTPAAQTANEVCETQGPNVWTKRISGTEAKVFIKCGGVGVSYRVEAQYGGSGAYSNVMTRTPISLSDSRQVFNDFGRYFVRTVEFGTRVRIRIYAGQALLWKVAYNPSTEMN